MRVLRFFLVLVLLVAFAGQFHVSTTFAAEVTRDEASSALNDADAAAAFAYQSVLKAEDAGANVSDLLNRLNEAGEFLASAHMEYERGDFETTLDFANLSRSIVEQVQADSVELRESAQSKVLQHMMFTMIVSIVSVAFIALGSLLVWNLLKKCNGTSEFPKVG